MTSRKICSRGSGRGPPGPAALPLEEGAQGGGRGVKECRLLQIRFQKGPVQGRGRGGTDRGSATAGPGNPDDACGIGEGTVTCTPRAILNAVYNAIGVRIDEIPVTPEKVLARR